MLNNKKLVEMEVDLGWDDVDVFPSKIYPDVAFLFQRMNNVAIEKMEVSSKDTVLDIGCGRAIDSIRLASRGGNCLGLEPSNKMINYAKNRIAVSGRQISLVQGIGEYLPFKTNSLDKVICKGALDHFPDPAKAIEEIARVLKPQGKAVILIANFESLGFKLGKWLFTVERIFPRWKRKRNNVWQIPVDHTCKLDYRILKHLVKPCLKVEQSSGVSLLFGLPGWSAFLDKLPLDVSLTILKILDKVAYHLPLFSDVIVLRCEVNNDGRINSEIQKDFTS